MGLKHAILSLAFLCLAGGAFAQTATVTVRVTDIESNEGQVYVGLCDRGFSERECLDGRFQPARAGSMTFVFENVPAGLYAVAAYHDVNMNEEMDSNFFGLPREPYGFSNDVGRRAPPNYLAAQFPVEPPGLTVNIRMARMRFGGG